MFTKRIALSLLALTVGAGITLASTTTNTPGAVCVASSGSLINGASGESANFTNASATAVCAADRSIAPTLSTKVSAVVWVVDESTSANVCCTINSKNPSGTLISSPQVCSSGSTYASQTLTLAQITDGYTYSHYYVSCTVPALSGGLISKILGYRTVQD